MCPGWSSWTARSCSFFTRLWKALSTLRCQFPLQWQCLRISSSSHSWKFLVLPEILLLWYYGYEMIPLQLIFISSTCGQFIFVTYCFVGLYVFLFRHNLYPIYCFFCNLYGLLILTCDFSFLTLSLVFCTGQVLSSNIVRFINLYDLFFLGLV